MAMQILTYDDSNMEVGEFYSVQVNKDLAPALVKVERRNVEVDFMVNKLIEIPDVTGNFIVWRWLNKAQDYKVNVTHGVSIMKKGNTLIVQANYDFEGQVELF